MDSLRREPPNRSSAGASGSDGSSEIRYPSPLQLRIDSRACRVKMATCQRMGGSMASIVRFYQLGGPENLKSEEIPLRPLKKGEVKLRVQAIGLNRAESMFYHGMYLEEPKLPAALGYE